MELLAGDRLGKYEIVGRLAAGGMAEVYLAKILGHAGFAKPVALKRMLPALACEPGFREMFMQEAALAARLNHPHVVQIFDFAEERGELYLAMEFVHGVNLRKLHSDALARSKSEPGLRLPPLLAGHVVRSVARALGYAWTVTDEHHQPLHLIHRDVSPHNILLSFQGDIKLADFGIAKPAGLHTSAGVLKGKLLYMSPEQLVAGPLDARTDVFALGIVLYETALGLRQPLFDAGNQAAVRQALKERRVAPPSRMDPEFPPMLSAAIMKALEREPEKRFQTANEFADALGESLHREAKSPQEFDLPAFMERLYGEAPPIRGLFTPVPAMPAAQNEADRVAEDANAATLLRSRTSEIIPAGRDQVAAPAEAAVPVDPAAVGWNKQKDRTTRRDRGVAGSRELASAVRQAQEASGALPSPKVPAALAQPSPPRPVGPRAPQPQPPSRVARLVVGLASVGAVALAIGLYAMWPPSKVEAPPPPLVVARPASIEVPVKADPVTPPAPDPTPPLRLAPHPEPAASPGPPVDPSPHPEPATGKVVAKGPAPAPANKKTGTLVVYVKPWVHAWVDAEPFTGAADQEAAPRLSRSLASGKHQVHLRDGMGHERQVEVNITPDHSITVDGVFEKLAVH